MILKCISHRLLSAVEENENSYTVEKMDKVTTINRQVSGCDTLRKVSKVAVKDNYN